METILYKPLFINPQAYYVFPNISGRLEPKTGSGKEPAIFVGNIEVKTIAHGDIGKKQYFYNTNEIDLSAFSNSLVRISLYTNRGNVVLGEWDLDIIEGESENYIDPEVLASLVAVCICDGKSNNDPDRAVIKNLVDPDNPFVISNAAYKLNSGYEKYEEDFTDWIIYPNIKVTDSVITTDGNFKSSWFIYKHSSKSKINEMNIKVSGIPKGGKISYIYISDETANLPIAYTIPKDGIYHLPESKINNNRASVGFTVESRYDWNNIRIEQIPSFEGAFVTDGVDDLITSTKTVQEMLGGSNEVTVVSMIHQIGLSSLTTINNIRSESVAHLVCRNICSSAGKTGIYGYSRQINTNNPPTLINNILGDKKDYTAEGNSALDPTDKFFVQGYKYSGTISEVSPIAYYWTFIANKVLTTDQINQVISYFNLDKHVKPDIIYDTIRQGITNENHASFNDELVDFSGNGHNMKIYNSAWNKESGINDEGAWQTDGVTDYGQYVGDLGLKDYTIAVDRAYVEAKPSQVSIMSNVVDGSTNTPFLMEHMGINKILAPHSFGKYTALSELNINRFISYQSTYKYNRNNLDRGTSTNTGSGLTIGRIGGVASQYANIALWSLLLFPYSMSEFLIERQLKRYKLGTLYPDMVEFRPIINVNIGKTYNVFEIRRTDTNELLYYYINGSAPNNKIGSYLPKGTNIRILVKWDNNRADVTQIKFNGKEYELNRLSDNSYYIDVTLDKSPQKIDIYADEYIRYEDIVQPYPAIINLKQDGKTITWGDKLKVGSDIVFVGSANLLPELYTVSETRYNGVTLYPNTIIKVEKSMVFDNARTYLKANEPSCILSPNRLRIPNSSYKILGYIPDLTGKGNHGRLNNFAYTEESGANEDGSIRFDGTDDHIIIPTIKHGGKALLMKVNWRYKNFIAMAYDQRINWGGLGISISQDQLPSVAYKPYNKVTYIDGIKNESVLVQDLEGITHNITGIYDNLDLSDERDVCISRTSDASNSGFADMSMYEFMLFPDVPNEEEIKELNDIVGIEGNTDDLLTKTNI